MEALRKLDTNVMVQGINPGRRLAQIDPWGFNCLRSNIQDFLGSRHPSQLCWRCNVEAKERGCCALMGLEPILGINVHYVGTSILNQGSKNVPHDV